MINRSVDGSLHVQIRMSDEESLRSIFDFDTPVGGQSEKKKVFN